MTTGNVLYLLMCLAMFGGLSAALAYYSHEKTKAEPEKRPAAPARPEPNGAVAG
jgi:hypothetical protein